MTNKAFGKHNIPYTQARRAPRTRAEPAHPRRGSTSVHTYTYTYTGRRARAAAWLTAAHPTPRPVGGGRRRADAQAQVLRDGPALRPLHFQGLAAPPRRTSTTTPAVFTTTTSCSSSSDRLHHHHLLAPPQDIANMLKIEVPLIDAMIRWNQKLIGKARPRRVAREAPPQPRRPCALCYASPSLLAGLTGGRAVGGCSHRWPACSTACGRGRCRRFPSLGVPRRRRHH